MTITVPDWVKGAVFYQIFPDRFRQGPVHHLPQGLTLKPWGTPASEQGLQGGDLYGIVEKLGYLEELGVTALYLNPVFASASNHRYHTYDYFTVDPLLGGEHALRLLLDEAHKRDIKVVLDGVFNHASRGFWAFHHILEEGRNSPYIDWFHIEKWPLNPYPKRHQEATNYESWWDLPALPKFNTDNPGVRDYLFSVAEHWIRFGIDGWRLDVPEEIDDDAFWQEFRRRVKAINSEAYICGEIWKKADHWLQGDQFDAVMNYPLGGAVLGFFGVHSLKLDHHPEHLELKPRTSSSLKKRVDEIYGWYDIEINQVQLNLLDSHDMARAKWILNDDVPALCQSLAFLLALPGAPCIYYGTEIGMSGGPDPDCREAFPWHKPEDWDLTIANVIRKQALARQYFPALGQGDHYIHILGKETLAVERWLDDDRAVVFFNRSKKAVNVTPPETCLGLIRLNDMAERTKDTLSDQCRISAKGCETFVS